MRTDDFWKLIADVSKQSAGDMDAKVKALTARLEAMDATEVLAFSREFDAMMDRAYTWGLWGAAYVIQGGCSDDGFTDFRSSLISMEKDVFERAVVCPDALADFPDKILNSLYFEGFAYPATSVYKEKTGSLPGRDAHPADPSGEPWDEDEEVLAQRFPRLWARYGDDPADPDGMDAPGGSGDPDVPSRPRPWWKFW